MTATEANVRWRLLVHGADVNAFLDSQRWTALDIAVGHGSDAACTQLLAAGAGADAHAACVRGAEPLCFALGHGRYKCLYLLLAAGVDIEAADERGRLEIWNKAGADRRDMQRLLVAAGATGCPVHFTAKELSAARAEIAAAKNEIESVRRQLKAERQAFVAKKILTMCIGLHSLELPAFVTLAILDEVLPGCLRDVVSMRFKC